MQQTRAAPAMRIGVTDPRTTLRAPLAALPPDSLVVGVAHAASPASRRVALALLEEAAAFGGGHVLHAAAANLLLGASRAAAMRAGAAMDRLLGISPQVWNVPDEAAALEAWLEALPTGPDAHPPLAALEARCTALPTEGLARLSFFATGAAREAVAQRLGPTDLDIQDPDLRAQGREWLCRRLLAALADPGQRGRLPTLRPGLRLLLDLPLHGLAGGRMMAGATGPNGPIALLPLPALAEPGFPAHSAGLVAAGWNVGLVANDAAALDFICPGHGALAAPAPALAPATPALAAGFVALGPAIPEWCRAPWAEAAGVLWELPA